MRSAGKDTDDVIDFLPVTFFSIPELRKMADHPKAFILRQRTTGDLKTKIYQVPAGQVCLLCPHTLAEHHNDEVNHGGFCCHRREFGKLDCKCDGFAMNVPADPGQS